MQYKFKTNKILSFVLLFAQLKPKPWILARLCKTRFQVANMISINHVCRIVPLPNVSGHVQRNEEIGDF